jgi:hypothetical protein
MGARYPPSTPHDQPTRVSEQVHDRVCEARRRTGCGPSAERMDDLPGFSGGNRRLREIWAEAGSRDLRTRFYTEEQQTFYAPKRGAYQLDHVFGDAATESRVVDWRVDTQPVLRHPTLSDHAPIWVELQ